MLQAKQGKSDGARFGPSEANYANAAASGRRSDGNDGVVEIQGIGDWGISEIE
jgi:hypothetical protein